MANTFAPNGFTPSKLYGGSPPNYQLETFPIAYNYGTQIGRGDPVELSSGTLIIMPASASNLILGIFWGVEYYDPVSQQYRWLPYWSAPSGLASTQSVLAKVYTARDMLFEAQINGTAATQANVGGFVDITTSSSGAPTAGNGISTCSLSSTIDTTTTKPFIVEAIVPSGAFTNFGNQQAGVPAIYDATQNNNWVVVKMNKLATKL